MPYLAKIEINNILKQLFKEMNEFFNDDDMITYLSILDYHARYIIRDTLYTNTTSLNYDRI